MKSVLLLTVLPVLLPAQADPAFNAYKAWDAEHRRVDHKARTQALFDASGKCRLQIAGDERDRSGLKNVDQRRFRA
jgi:hypothetical protein